MSKLATGASERGRHPDSEIDKADDNLEERVERAIERRARILQEIKTISQVPDAVPLPNAAVQLPDTVPLPDAAVQLFLMLPSRFPAPSFFMPPSSSLGPLFRSNCHSPLSETVFLNGSIIVATTIIGITWDAKNLRSCWMRLTSCRLRGGEAIYSTEPLATENLIF